MMGNQVEGNKFIDIDNDNCYHLNVLLNCTYEGDLGNAQHKK